MASVVTASATVRARHATRRAVLVRALRFPEIHAALERLVVGPPLARGSATARTAAPVPSRERPRPVLPRAARTARPLRHRCATVLASVPTWRRSIVPPSCVPATEVESAPAAVRRRPVGTTATAAVPEYAPRRPVLGPRAGTRTSALPGSVWTECVAPRPAPSSARPAMQPAPALGSRARLARVGRHAQPPMRPAQALATAPPTSASTRVRKPCAPPPGALARPLSTTRGCATARAHAQRPHKPTAQPRASIAARTSVSRRFRMVARAPAARNARAATAPTRRAAGAGRPDAQGRAWTSRRAAKTVDNADAPARPGSHVAPARVWTSAIATPTAGPVVMLVDPRFARPASAATRATPPAAGAAATPTTPAVVPAVPARATRCRAEDVGPGTSNPTRLKDGSRRRPPSSPQLPATRSRPSPWRPTGPVRDCTLSLSRLRTFRHAPPVRPLSLPTSLSSCARLALQ